MFLDLDLQIVEKLLRASLLGGIVGLQRVILDTLKTCDQDSTPKQLPDVRVALEKRRD